MDFSNLRPMVCTVCNKVNPMQEMINTAGCIYCFGEMVYLDDVKKDIANLEE